MQFLSGLLTAAVLFSCLYGAYMVGRRSEHPTVTKEADEEAVHKARKLREGFEELMSYNETIARRKKVT